MLMAVPAWSFSYTHRGTSIQISIFTVLIIATPKMTPQKREAPIHMCVALNLWKRQHVWACHAIQNCAVLAKTDRGQRSNDTPYKSHSR